jgi:hypothetical protein
MKKLVLLVIKRRIVSLSVRKQSKREKFIGLEGKNIGFKGKDNQTIESIQLNSKINAMKEEKIDLLIEINDLKKKNERLSTKMDENKKVKRKLKKK